VLPAAAPFRPDSALDIAESRLDIALSAREGRRGGCTEMEDAQEVITSGHRRVWDLEAYRGT